MHFSTLFFLLLQLFTAPLFLHHLSFQYYLGVRTPFLIFASLYYVPFFLIVSNFSTLRKKLPYSPLWLVISLGILWLWLLNSPGILGLTLTDVEIKMLIALLLLSLPLLLESNRWLTLTVLFLLSVATSLSSFFLVLQRLPWQVFALGTGAALLVLQNELARDVSSRPSISPATKMLLRFHSLVWGLLPATVTIFIFRGFLPNYYIVLLVALALTPRLLEKLRRLEFHGTPPKEYPREATTMIWLQFLLIILGKLPTEVV